MGAQTQYEQLGVANGVVARFGNRVSYVQPGSPVQRAGIEVGDIIVGYFQGEHYRQIFGANDLPTAISTANQSMRVKIIDVRNGQHAYININFQSNGNGGYGNGGYGNGGYGNGGYNSGQCKGGCRSNR